MRVFVTGASGFVGSAVVKELVANGHTVAGLSRSEDNARTLAALGATAHPGDLENLDTLRSGAAEADGVIHCGFIHDFSRFAEICAVDEAAIQAMGEVLEGTQKPMLVTSGLARLAPGRTATEDDAPPSDRSLYPRVSEGTAEAFAARGVRASSIRLSPTTHGQGDHGFVPQIIAAARANGVSAYIGDGSARWPGVHRTDAAKLYRLALEQGAVGARWHGVADEGVPMRDIAEVIGRHLNLPVVSLTPEQAPAHFGFLAMFVGADMPASSAKTRAALGWTPTEPGLIADLDLGHYFTT